MFSQVNQYYRSWTHLIIDLCRHFSVTNLRFLKALSFFGSINVIFGWNKLTAGRNVWFGASVLF